MSGRFTGKCNIYTLVLPSLFFCCFSFCFCLFISDVGEIHMVVFLFNSRSPYCVFSLIETCILAMGAWAYDTMMRAQGWWYHPSPILYIYSLGHFLTTKGALIDGDGYPPKNPKKGSKKGQNLIKNWLKLRQKNTQKRWFLMWKRTFWHKIT